MNKEQIIQMARDAGWDEHHCEFDTRILSFAAAIRSAVKEEDAKICEEQGARSREASEASKRIQEQHLYHHCAVTAGWNAAAIRASK